MSVLTTDFLILPKVSIFVYFSVIIATTSCLRSLRSFFLSRSLFLWHSFFQSFYLSFILPPVFLLSFCDSLCISLLVRPAIGDVSSHLPIPQPDVPHPPPPRARAGGAAPMRGQQFAADTSGRLYERLEVARVACSMPP